MTYTETIDRFDGGISSELRTKETNVAGDLQHFDVYRNHLRPFRSTEADEAHTGGSPANKAADIVKFVYAPDNTDYNLYGFGVSSGAVAQFYEKNTDPITGLWSTGIGAAGTGARNELVASYYKNYIYYWQGGTTLARFGALSGSRGIANFQSVSYTTVAEPVHHPADDSMYFFADNKVYRLADTTWDGLVLTLPDNLKIVSATAWGNFLVIGCAPVDSVSASSTLFFWDRDSSLATITDKVDLGKGELKHIGNVDGIVRVVIDYFTGNAFAADGRKIIAKEIIGTRAVTTHELEVTTTGGAFFNNCNKQETGKELLWGMKLVRDNDTISGVWTLDKNGAMYCTHIEEDDDGSGIQGFLKLGNYWWIAHSDDGSVNRTNDQETYSFSSIYTTKVLAGSDRKNKKQILGVTVFTEPQPTAGVVTLKYRKDSETSFTTIGTSSTDGETNHVFFNVSGSPFPTFQEIQLRVETKGGTVVTGLEYEAKVLTDKAY